EPGAREVPSAGPQESSKIIPIVGIGSSAGGLEALQEFFSHTPTDTGIAFVVITHQQAGRVSLLPELLRKVTGMPLLEAVEGLRVKPDHVYVAVPEGLLEIGQGTLHVATLDTGRSSPGSIDHFFRHLSADREEHAICIVLSGAGTDGTLGARAIKAAGGMVMVQEPSSAKYSSMPNSAIATGLVDYVLPPAEMPRALQDYTRGPYLSGGLSRRDQSLLPSQEIQRILVQLRLQTGHDFTGYKRGTMARRIGRRMNVHQLENARDYCRYLQQNHGEGQLLLRELLISVTSFFRDSAAFEVLAEKALPGLLLRDPLHRTLRVWVPGCATGEEAYSVAILLHEQLQKVQRPVEVQIFGTDLDERAIGLARAGQYPDGISADVSPERLERYFTREDRGYRIRKEIRELLVFATQDVIKDPPFTKLDLIVCRNLLIYLESEVQRRLLPVFHYALRPGGILFLGSSESVGTSGELFETVDSRWKILRRKDTGTYAGPAPRFPAAHPKTTAIEEAAEEGPSRAVRTHISNLLERVLIERFAPTSVVVDGSGNTVFVHGRTGPYLELAQGRPTSNIFDMAREGLAPALVAALRRAQSEKKEVSWERVRVRTNHAFSLTNLSVIPIQEPEAIRGLFVITFTPVLDGPIEVEPSETESQTGREADLERELRLSRESLQTTIEEMETSNEELRSSNEELQSTNEELQSTNEEMETSKEEMQSLNEELNTVNAELSSKVEELAHANDDLKNLLNATQVATIYLDERLRVKRYTEAAKEVIPLIESDVGRPLSDLATTLRYERLVEDCRQVLATLAPRERYVTGADQRSYIVRIMPYRTSENAIKGMVITIFDLARLLNRSLEENLVREYLEGVIQTVRAPLVVLDRSLHIISASEAFLETFHFRREDVQDRRIYDLSHGTWKDDRLRQLLESTLPPRETVQGFDLERTLESGDRIVLQVNAQKIKGRDRQPILTLLAFEEVSRRGHE
ncbi:MAG: CheR family methyltransferase, partial [Acidobacteriota bacterium]